MPVVSAENDVVDMDLFWEKMEFSLIARGLLKGDLLCSFQSSLHSTTKHTKQFCSSSYISSKLEIVLTVSGSSLR